MAPRAHEISRISVSDQHHVRRPRWCSRPWSRSRPRWTAQTSPVCGRTAGRGPVASGEGVTFKRYRLFCSCFPAVVISSLLDRLSPVPPPLPLIQIGLGRLLAYNSDVEVVLNPAVFFLLFLPLLLFLDGWRMALLHGGSRGGTDPSKPTYYVTRTESGFATSIIMRFKPSARASPILPSETPRGCSLGMADCP